MNKLERLSLAYCERGIKHSENEPLSAYSTFRVGGAAAMLVRPSSADELVFAVEASKGAGVRSVVVGNGSNLLFADAGFDGAVIVTTDMSRVNVNENRITADCGVSFTRLAMLARDAGLSGLEFAYGIPGTVGGAVFMNAGAYGGETSQVLVESRVYDGESVKTYDLDSHKLSYRHSTFADNGGLTVLESTFELIPGDRAEISEKMSSFMAARREKQPLEFPSAGSTFKRPPNNFSGKLIEESGLKGFTVGGAQVSEKHAGFVVNRGGATADDILKLISHVKDTVLKDHNILLECEVKYIC